MTTKLTFIISLLSIKLVSQTITYSNFSNALTNTVSINIATNASFNSTLTSVTGNGVSWNASGLMVQPGTPVVHISFGNPASTPNGNLFPGSNYVEYDPALTSIVGYNYHLYNADSVSLVGSYEPSAAHEIFQNYDKHLIFPFNYGQSFTDTYSKTNYSNATTVSSYQTGSRTVMFNGFGTLILPQGTFNNVALISETRTNSLGPVSYEYTWYDISNGKKLLFRSENGSSITTAWCNEVSSGITENKTKNYLTVFPNPVNNISTLKIQTDKKLTDAVLKFYDITGADIKTIPVKSNEISIEKEEFSKGLLFYNLFNNNELISSGKLIIQ